MNYPISLSFKLLALAPQIYVRGADGTLLYYVKMKLFKLKEAVNVFADEAQKEARYSIKADRIIDFNASYAITDTAGNEIGKVKRRGMRSLWKAQYDVFQGEEHALTIQEESAWVRVLEKLLSDIPIVGFVAVMLLNPTYLVARTDGTLLLKVKKMPAFFEGKFEITQQAQMPPEEEAQALMSVLMMTLLERSRG